MSADGGGELLESVRLFDRPRNTGAGQKSLAFALRMQATDRTLTDEDIAAGRGRLASAGQLGAELRGEAGGQPYDEPLLQQLFLIQILRAPLGEAPVAGLCRWRCGEFVDLE